MLTAKTIVKTGEITDIKYYCRIDKMYHTIYTAHLKVGHKKEKAMETEFKKSFVTLLKRW